MTLPITRTARTWWSRGLIVSLLFMQLASAAYACTRDVAADDSAAMAGMPCDQAMAGRGMTTMDPDQPGLCFEHCKGGSPTIEPAATAGVAMPALPLLFVVEVPGESTGDSPGGPAQRRSRDSARPPPPHAILHCCFRI